MIYTQLTPNQIAQAIYADEYNSISHEGAIVLAEWLEDIYDGQQCELDVVAIRCDFSEYSLQDLYDLYDHMIDISDFDKNNEEHAEQFLEFIQDHTPLIQVNPTTYIIQDF